MRRILVMAAAAMLSFTAKAQNASTSGAQTADLNLSNALEISFTGNATNIINVQFGSLSDMINGVETATHEILVRSNKKFKVTVKPSSNNFSYTGNALIGTLLKVSTVIKIQVANNNTGGSRPLTAQLTGWQNFSVLGLPVTLLNNCNPGDNQTFTVKYKATPGTNCVAGNYSADMVYTATQQ